MEELLLQCGLRLIVVTDDRTEGAWNESEGRNTNEHEQNAENALPRRPRDNITIANSTNRHDYEVNRHDIAVAVWLGLPDLHPRCRVVLFKVCEQNEHTRRHMDEQSEKRNEDGQTFETVIDAQSLCHFAQ